ncbi:MAG: hypothetical protein ABS951_04115 [Solibacillus sp.]
MFFRSGTAQQKVDLYDKITFIVKTLLQKELPEHRAQHHLLYTANTQLAHYRELAETHRKQAFSQSALSYFHQQTYEQLLKKHNQLQLIIDAYMELHLDIPRDLYNHRLRLDDQNIELVYDELHRMKDYNLSQEHEPSFWQAIKEQIFPTFAKLVP